mmetsp:Transcript_87299/g.236653  ORF Transcript_87299/g.236653 Transcript_87299/m.236653 type:complete len:255 (+) Transcript_87299:923-1687(+)
MGRAPAGGPRGRVGGVLLGHARAQRRPPRGGGGARPQLPPGRRGRLPEGLARGPPPPRLGQLVWPELTLATGGRALPLAAAVHDEGPPEPGLHQLAARRGQFHIASAAFPVRGAVLHEPRAGRRLPIARRWLHGPGLHLHQHREHHRPGHRSQAAVHHGHHLCRIPAKRGRERRGVRVWGPALVFARGGGHGEAVAVAGVDRGLVRIVLVQRDGDKAIALHARDYLADHVAGRRAHPLLARVLGVTRRRPRRCL